MNSVEQYISDIVRAGDFQTGTFNLIDAGCGSGKTYFCMNHIFDIFPGVLPSQVVVITSRSITATQMERNESVQVTRVQAYEFQDADVQAMIDKGLIVMTYDAASKYLMQSNSGRFIDDTIKIIVVDECHALFADKFIKDMDWIIMSLNMIIARGKSLVIGLTATSGIVRRYWGDAFTSIRDVCPPIPTRYPAKHLVLTRTRYVPGLIETFTGKTLVLVPTTKWAARLHRMIPNSAIVVSKSHKPSDEDDVVYEKYMDGIRQHIIDSRTLPDVVTVRNYKSGDNETYPLDVLIATTTLREGFNLDAASGVKNIVCCFFDELNITQFLGRCRYSVDNLAIAPPDKITLRHQYAEYFNEFQDSYKELWNGGDLGWLSNVKSLVAGDVYQDTDIFMCDVDNVAENFHDSVLRYLNGEWFYSKDWTVIVDTAREWKVLPDVKLNHYSKTNIKDYICSLGYTYEAEQDKTRNKRARYRFIKENNNVSDGDERTND